MGKRQKEGLLDGAGYAILAIALVFVLFPLFWLVEASLKKPVITNSYPPRFWGFTPVLSDYSSVLKSATFHLALRNSLIASVGSVLVAVLAGSLTAYALVRLRPYGRSLLILAIVLVQTVPGVVLIIPLFSIVSALNLYDQLFTEIIVLAALETPFATWVMVAFIRNIPLEVEEAALVDGASRIGLMRRIVLPMARPGLATAAIFSAIFSWNQFLVPLVLTNERATPLTVYITNFVTQEGIQWGPLCAATVIVLIPAALFVLSQQRRLVGGLTMGSLGSGR
jgi:multiple sugar transport system permease protein